MLANEQVVDGGCWRCGTHGRRTRELEQWFFRITHYADELLEGLDRLTEVARKGADDAAELDRADREGARVRFRCSARSHASVRRRIEVFTTRIDTIYGATFVLLAPEHPLVRAFAARAGDPQAFARRSRTFRAQDRTARMTGEVEKEGFVTGRYAINPFTGEPVPIWVANFVLGEYGTGAVMAVPAHDSATSSSHASTACRSGSWSSPPDAARRRPRR